MTQRPFRICLIMHSTRSDNLGVGALTVSEVEVLRKISADTGRKIEITVMDWKDPREPYVSGDDIRIVDMDSKTILNPFGFFATVRRSDLVIDIGAGDSFADIYGSRRLHRMFAMKFLTHFARTPLVVAPQTIGPFHKPISRFLARLSMQWSAVVATRDTLSTDAAKSMGVRREIIEASDLALRLPYDPPPPRTSTHPIRVGINVSGLLMGGGYTGQNEFGLTMDYPGLMRDLIRHFQEHKDGCEVHLVPHVIVAHGRLLAEDDYRASVALAEECPGTIVAPAFATPSEAKSYIAGMDFFLGARMHACIAAFSSGVPVVPMAYSRKFEGLFGSLGYDRTVDCTNEAQAVLFQKIAAAFEQRETVRMEAEAAMIKGLARLDRYQTALESAMLSQVSRP